MSFVTRKRIYFGIAIFSFFCGILFVFLKHRINFAVSDGRGYYVYLPSVIIDGDLNFENQIRNEWDVDFNEKLLVNRTPTQLIPNKYPIGFALSVSPAFLLADGLTRVFLAEQEHTGYTWLYQVLCFAMILGLGLASFLLIDRCLTRLGFSDRAILFGILSYWLSTNFYYYYFREPFMVHVVSQFWVVGFFYLVLRKDLSVYLKYWFLISLCAAMAVVCRPTNLLLLLPFNFMLPLREVFRPKVLFAATFGLLPILLQLLVWKILYGNYFSYSYGGESFYWFQPHLIDSLFSSKHGLFFWSPALVMAFCGIVLQTQSSDRNLKIIATLGLISFSLLWYANSSWHEWWFGDAFGARSFIELGFLFVFGFATVFSIFEMKKGISILISIISMCAVFNLILMALYISKRIPRADYLF